MPLCVHPQEKPHVHQVKNPWYRQQFTAANISCISPICEIIYLLYLVNWTLTWWLVTTVIVIIIIITVIDLTLFYYMQCIYKTFSSRFPVLRVLADSTLVS